MVPDVREAFVKAFPFLTNGQGRLVDRLLATAAVKPFTGGEPLYFEGDGCQGIGFLLSGEIRVFKIGENGREVTLYEIFPGETCILNASCLLSRQRYPANATALSAGTILLIPGGLFLELMTESQRVRTFIFSLFSRRFSEIIELLEEITFGNLTERLTDYLVEKSSNDRLHVSHQTIANDLGSSREVISRLLKDFERKGKVALSRNQVTLIRL